MLDSYAKNITEEFPEDSLEEMKSTDFSEFAFESYYICRNFIYKSFVFNEKPSEILVQKSFQLIKRRIALAGYRLSHLLEEIYSKYSQFNIKEASSNLRTTNLN